MPSSTAIFAKSILFCKEVVYESKKIIWPDRRDVTVTSIIVLVLSAIFGVFFFIVDQILGSCVHFILGMSING